MGTINDHPQIEPKRLYAKLIEMGWKISKKFKINQRYHIDDDGLPSIRSEFEEFEAKMDGITLKVIPEDIESPKYHERYTIKKIEASPENLEQKAREQVFAAVL